MLKIISSGNESEVYKLIRKEKEILEKKLGLKFLNFTTIKLDEAESLAQNISIFSDVEMYIIKFGKVNSKSPQPPLKVGEKEQSSNDEGEEDLSEYESEVEETGKELLLNEKLFEVLNESPHLFFIVGEGVAFEKKCDLVGKKFGIKINKIENIKKFDFPSELVSALQKNDKKNSWNLLLKELDKKDAEPVHGACVYAYKTLLVYLNDPKKNSLQSGVKDFPWNNAKRNALLGKREKKEVEEKYFNLVLAHHKARMGELDLGKQLEMWVLN